MLTGAATAGVRDRWAERLPGWLRGPRLVVGALVTFHLWTFSLVFFRSASLGEAFSYLDGLWSRMAWSKPAIRLDMPWKEFYAIALPIVVLMALEIWRGRRTWLEFLERRSAPFRLVLYLALFFSILVLSPLGSQEFIYFQF
jgi:hypothetical protein